MKVFWSWQADTEGKTGRHFVRDVLASALSELREELTVYERQEIQLDHDRLGLTGSPDLAPAIYAKIREATVFVADVTTVGSVTIHGGTVKRMINNNVGIELGFAAGTLGDEAILMVQNSYYGGRDDLPFDLRGKAGPIEFSLPPGATRDEMETQAKVLRQRFKAALRLFLPLPPAVETAPLERRRWQSTPLQFEGSERLDVLRSEGKPSRHVRFDAERGIYLRFMPRLSLAEPLTSARCLEIAESQHLALLYPDMRPGQAARNPQGAAVYRLRSPEGKNAAAATQLFHSGEIWAVTEAFFGSDTFLAGQLLEPLVRVLRSFHETSVHKLGGVATPIGIEIGAVGLSGLHCDLGLDRIVGPYFEDWIRVEATLQWTDFDPEREAIAQKFIDRTVEEAGERVAR